MDQNSELTAQAEDVSQERLQQIVDAGDMWCGDPESQLMARELTALRQENECDAHEFCLDSDSARKRRAEKDAEIKRHKQEAHEYKGLLHAAEESAQRQLTAAQEQIARLERHNKQLVEQIAQMRESAEEAFPQIEAWSQAYPEDAFIEPDWAEVKGLLGPTLLTKVSAANMRHVAKRMWGIIQPVSAALAAPEADQPKVTEAGPNLFADFGIEDAEAKHAAVVKAVDAGEYEADQPKGESNG